MQGIVDFHFIIRKTPKWCQLLELILRKIKRKKFGIRSETQSHEIMAQVSSCSQEGYPRDGNRDIHKKSNSMTSSVQKNLVLELLKFEGLWNFENCPASQVASTRVVVMPPPQPDCETRMHCCVDKMQNCGTRN